MNLLKKEYDRFLDKARNNDFKSPDGIFINDICITSAVSFSW